MWRGYFGTVISIARLRDRLEDDRVSFNKWGHPVEIEIPAGLGPATMLVVEVTDALKDVDFADRVTGSVDRAGMWSVQALVLDRSVLQRLEGDEMPVEDLIEAVEAAGVAWSVSPISGP